MRKSRLFKVDVKEIRNIVENSYSIQEVLMKLNYKNNTYGYPWIKEIIKKEDINISNFKKMEKKKELSEYLVIGKRLYNKTKNKVISQILGNNCSECNLTDQWNGKYIKLQIDHINGNPFDNRIENLRVLCPNCHSQTENFGSKNIKKKDKLEKTKIKKEKKPRYTIDLILPFIGKEPISKISERLGISQKTIRLICRKNGVSYPTHMDWAKNPYFLKKVKDKLSGKPFESIRKHNYEKIYASYQRTAEEFKLDRGSVRTIILRHKKYIK